jgi:putative hydrolase of the HAD superfamily
LTKSVIPAEPEDPLLSKCPLLVKILLMKLKPELITFDFGDTLVTSEPPHLTRIWMTLKELDVVRTLQEVERAYHLSDSNVSAALLEEGGFTPEDYQRRLGEGLLKELGVEAGLQKLLEDLYRQLVAVRPERVMVKGADKLLAELKKRGYRMGIISNNDGTTRRKCQAVGIEGYFEFILDSTLEGMVKPDARVFKKALERAKVSADQTLHIGDLWGCDVLGATSAGLFAGWIRNNYIVQKKRERVFEIETPDQALEFIE